MNKRWSISKKRCFVFAFWSIFLFSKAQTFNPFLAQALQNKLDSLRVANNIKGISAGVFHPRMGTWKSVSGISHTGTPLTSDMLFGIASNSKLFTGTLILKLVENNLIQLNDSLFRYLPSYHHIDSNITIRQLLNHTSGLADVTSVPGYPDSMMNNPNRIFTAHEMMGWAGPPLFSPGTSWSYCNTNYLLAGMIAERVTGRPYHQLLRDSILTPLQLDSTFLDVYERLGYPVAQPWQAGINNHSIPRTSVNSAAWSAGAMYSNSSEMLQWYNALFNGNFLGRNSFAEMTRFVGTGNYGIGISRNSVIGRTVWTHGGTIWGGYNSSMMYDTATGIVVCVLINQLPAQAYQMAAQLLSIMVQGNVGIIDPSGTKNTIEIFPNPTEGMFEVRHVEEKVGPLKVFDVFGNLLFETSERFISLAQYPKGIYFLQGTTSLGNVNVKIVRN